MTRRAVQRRAVGLVALLAGELYLLEEYVRRGTGWHFLLHSLIGAAAGLVGATALAAARRRPGPALSPVGWAAAGQAFSVLPDVLFPLARLPHQRWMDVFLGHITVHLAWQPLIIATGCFLVAGWGWWLAAHAGRPALGVALAGLAVAVVVGALATAKPLPTRLADYARIDQSWCGPGLPPGAGVSP